MAQWDSGFCSAGAQVLRRYSVPDSGLPRPAGASACPPCHAAWGRAFCRWCNAGFLLAHSTSGMWSVSAGAGPSPQPQWSLRDELRPRRKKCNGWSAVHRWCSEPLLQRRRLAQRGSSSSPIIIEGRGSTRGPTFLRVCAYASCWLAAQSALFGGQLSPICLVRCRLWAEWKGSRRRVQGQPAVHLVRRCTPPIHPAIRQPFVQRTNVSIPPHEHAPRRFAPHREKKKKESLGPCIISDPAKGGVRRGAKWRGRASYLDGCLSGLPCGRYLALAPICSVRSTAYGGRRSALRPDVALCLTGNYLEATGLRTSCAVRGWSGACAGGLAVSESPHHCAVGMASSRRESCVPVGVGVLTQPPLGEPPRAQKKKVEKSHAHGRGATVTAMTYSYDGCCTCIQARLCCSQQRVQHSLKPLEVPQRPHAPEPGPANCAAGRSLA